MAFVPGLWVPKPLGCCSGLRGMPREGIVILYGFLGDAICKTHVVPEWYRVSHIDPSGRGSLVLGMCVRYIMAQVVSKWYHLRQIDRRGRGWKRRRMRRIGG